MNNPRLDVNGIEREYKACWVMRTKEKPRRSWKSYTFTTEFYTWENKGFCSSRAKAYNIYYTYVKLREWEAILQAQYDKA